MSNNSASCPRCGNGTEMATCLGPKKRKPKPGDFSVCGRCGLPLRFDENKELVAATDQDIEDLDPAARTMLLRAAAALGSEMNPVGRSSPGEHVVEVMWVESNEGKGMMVRANGPANVGLGVLVLCQTIIASPESFDEPTQAAAKALIHCLTRGRTHLPRMEVFRGTTGKS